MGDHTSVRVDRCEGPEQFLERAVPFLVRHEAEHNLLLGVATAMARAPAPPVPPAPAPRWLVAEAGDEVVGAAMRTPPYGAVLSRQAPGGAQAFAMAFDELGDDLPTVQAAPRDVADFVSAWIARRGGTSERALGLIAHECDAVRPPKGALGRFRIAGHDDAEVLAAWLEAFAAEALPRDPRSDGTAMAARVLDDAEATVALWEDEDDVVAMGVASWPTPTGIRVWAVYTPPERRRRGYAGALTAALTQRALDAGRRRVFLFADADNPLTNRLYARIGYTPVAESEQWRLVPVGTTEQEKDAVRRTAPEDGVSATQDRGAP